MGVEGLFVVPLGGNTFVGVGVTGGGQVRRLATLHGLLLHLKTHRGGRGGLLGVHLGRKVVVVEVEGGRFVVGVELVVDRRREDGVDGGRCRVLAQHRFGHGLGHLSLGDALRLLLHDGGHGSKEHYHSSDVVVRASVARCFHQAPTYTIRVTIIAGEVGVHHVDGGLGGEGVPQAVTRQDQEVLVSLDLQGLDVTLGGHERFVFSVTNGSRYCQLAQDSPSALDIEDTPAHLLHPLTLNRQLGLVGLHHPDGGAAADEQGLGVAEPRHHQPLLPNQCHHRRRAALEFLFAGFLDEVRVGDVEGVFEGGLGVGLILGVLDHVLVEMGSTVHGGVYPCMAVKHTVVCMWLLEIEAVEGAKVVDDDVSVLHLSPSVLDGEVTDGVVAWQLLHLGGRQRLVQLLDHRVGLAGDVLDQLHDVIGVVGGVAGVEVVHVVAVHLGVPDGRPHLVPHVLSHVRRTFSAI